MFPANEMVLAAEVAYRRERLTAVKPRRRTRRFRRPSLGLARTAPQGSQGARLA